IDDYYIGGTQHSVSPVREASVIAIIFSKDWTDVLDDFEPLFKKYFNKRLEEGFKGE
ncbi:MAG: hypothetical protein GWN01_14750, partial [Nitrosopumilaceae archaeon]|nr:hypothetical protein [Nitrosopumilaceae archaeon]NIU86481.1 hypothetical protein [Nitrosopumilaceae archaeon]NIV66184.1 hypothetical protein [Nitrosopumilaceae archaeon]NIX62710.1 hypothetical protein [Nitrosopumilaceae archaeon]